MTRRGAWALLVCLTGASCASSAPGDEPSAPDPVGGREATIDAAAAVARVPWLPAGTSIDGRPIEHAVFGTGDEVVLYVATIHGDEFAGTELLHAFARRLASGPDWLRGRCVVLVPVANPDGFASKRRGNARGVDLNRNFPAANRSERRGHGSEALSEPESRALAALIERFVPDRVISFHQPASQIDYDGPAEGLARAMGEVTSLPVARMGARPGSLGSWVGVDRGVPIITVELRGPDGHLDGEELWEEYGALVLAALLHAGPIQD